MTITARYINGKEIGEEDIKKIKLTDNKDIAEIIDRVIKRVNCEQNII